MKTVKKGLELFLPYQNRWLNDKSKIKIWEKSRRIGATWVQAYEDVYDCLKGAIPAVWFSSADESAAKEYILYCAYFAKLFNAPFKELGEQLIDEKDGILAFMIEFTNGTRINALSSNPKAFRSKGGKVVIDEFAFHKQPRELWAAARPVITWGYPLRILSTHNGKNSHFYRFVDAIHKQKSGWSLHSTPIDKAVDEGLADKIAGRKLSKKERGTWIENERKSCADDAIWQQEYCCNPIDEEGAFLPYDVILKCERSDILNKEIENPFYVGMDVARKKHLSVIWGFEDIGGILISRIYKVMKNQKFSTQYDALKQVLQHPNMRRACIDQTGIGMQLAETAVNDFGKYRVEGVTFTNHTKEAIAYELKTKLEDCRIVLPDDPEVREDLHSIRRIVTSAGNTRLDATETETLGHGDRFWSMALAVHAAGGNKGDVVIASRSRRNAERIDDESTYGKNSISKIKWVLNRF